MSNARTNERVNGLSLSMATLGGPSAPTWEPNWIDYRSSVANVDRRGDRDDDAETCVECGCETDVVPEPHSPKCPTLTLVESGNGHRSSVEGRELLDRMDAGEPVGLEEAEDEGSSEPETAIGAAAVASDSASSSPRLKWTREKVVAAIREVGQNVGRTPSHRDMREAGYISATVNTTLDRLRTTWAELVGEAGYEPRQRGDNGKASARVERPEDSEREPQADTTPSAKGDPGLDATVAGASSRSDDHLLVKPEEMPPFQRAIARALIAGLRSFADALEQELAA